MNSKVEITYSNSTKQYQILRIEDLRCYVERVIPPRQTITFEAFLDATAKIYTGDFATALLTEKTLVYNLAEIQGSCDQVQPAT
ncbi:MAG: DUF1830 domain-containing protein [Xenococcus sp. (in: cyanobacteria)]